MGKPAARLGDMTMHGGTIVLGIPTVLIGGQPAARIGDMHACPMVNPGVPPPPHVGGPVTLGSAGVLIGGQPAARVGDMVTCAGPPDTIAPPGCLTVLIGETMAGGGGGGGAGGAGSGGAKGAATKPSLIGLAVATYGGEPPEHKPGEDHWVEYQFVDKAGNPVGGIPFEYKGSDNKATKGILASIGKIIRKYIPSGNTSVKLFSISNAQWSAEEAKAQDTVKMTADVDGFAAGTPARITVYKRDLNGGDKSIETIVTKVQGKKVEAEWKYSYEGEGSPGESDPKGAYSRPEYYFVAEVSGCNATSGFLALEDWIEFKLTNAEGEAIPGEKYKVVLSNGEIRTGELDKNGTAKLEDIPPGNCKVEFINFPEVECKK